jgi:zinc D-Ala-D-Ala carboxypeptidase
MKLKVFTIITILLIVAGATWFLTVQPDSTLDSIKANRKTDHDVKSVTAKVEPIFDKNQLSIDDPASIWVVTNKQRPLRPQNYIPADLVFPLVRLRVPGNESMQLRTEAAGALEEMFAGASNDGIELMLSSGYRSYKYQVNLYGSYVKSQGQAQADTQSARPGYSEHQTGLAADLRPINGKCELEQCFGDLPEGKWVAENAHTYGFIIRYPAQSKQVVGYEYEPWHIRYVGKDLAAEYIRTNATTLEGFFDLLPAPDYSS